jgi:hypothetical protein
LRLWSIALFIFLFNLTIAFLSSDQILGLTASHEGIQSQDWGLPNPSTVYGEHPDPNLWIMIGDFASSIPMFFKIFLNSTIFLPIMLSQIGFPTTLALIIGGGVNFLYVIGVLQIVRGINIE